MRWCWLLLKVMGRLIAVGIGRAVAGTVTMQIIAFFIGHISELVQHSAQHFPDASPTGDNVHRVCATHIKAVQREVRHDEVGDYVRRDTPLDTIVMLLAVAMK
jgi:hypothetical protein